MVKNTFELKNAQRVTVDGNLLENCWSAGQYGYAIVLTPRNSGSAPWTRVQDVTFTNNIVRHVAGVLNIAGFDDSDPTLRTERITFRNNLFDDVNHTVYGTSAKALLVGDGAADLVFDRNTIIHTNSSVLYAYGAAMSGLVYTNNISQHHRYGIMGDGATTGIPTITRYFPGAIVRCNVLAGGSAVALSDAERLSERRRLECLVRQCRRRRLPADPGQSGGVRRLFGNDPWRRRREAERRRRRGFGSNGGSDGTTAAADRRHRRRTSRRWRMPAVHTPRPSVR